ITSAALANAEKERISNGQNGSVLPDNYIPKQTLTNATRYFTPQLKEYETIVLTAEDTLNDLEAEEYRKLLKLLSDNAAQLLAAAEVIAGLDVGAALAEVAVDGNYTRPKLTDDDRIHIVEG